MSFPIELLAFLALFWIVMIVVSGALIAINLGVATRGRK